MSLVIGIVVLIKLILPIAHKTQKLPLIDSIITIHIAPAESTPGEAIGTPLHDIDALILEREHGRDDQSQGNVIITVELGAVGEDGAGEGDAGWVALGQLVVGFVLLLFLGRVLLGLQ